MCYKTPESPLFSITIQGEELILLPEKAIFWPFKKMLILSDLHIGKAGHFQKNGIPLPTESTIRDLKRLDALIEKFNPESVVIVGDMFHNKKNAEWEPFERWRSQNSDIYMILVMGNHEILPEQYYQVLDLKTTNYLCEKPFIFLHDTTNQYNLFDDYYRLGGHVHPAVRIRGKGKQTHTLSCFYVTEDFLLLPAFGSLTGNYLIDPKDNEQAYVIVQNQVIPL